MTIIICSGWRYLTGTFVASSNVKKSAPNTHYNLQRAVIPEKLSQKNSLQRAGTAAGVFRQFEA